MSSLWVDWRILYIHPAFDDSSMGAHDKSSNFTAGRCSGVGHGSVAICRHVYSFCRVPCSGDIKATIIGLIARRRYRFIYHFSDSHYPESKTERAQTIYVLYTHMTRHFLCKVCPGFCYLCEKLTSAISRHDWCIERNFTMVDLYFDRQIPSAINVLYGRTALLEFLNPSLQMCGFVWGGSK